MKTKFLILLCVALCACSEKEVSQPEKIKNPISFCINFVNEDGESCGDLIYSNNISEYFTVKYKDVVYNVKKDCHNEYEIYLSCHHKYKSGYIVEFGGIDGSKEFENESFTIDCGTGETNVITFSNRKVVTDEGETFVQECKLNGVSVDKSQIDVKLGIHSYNSEVFANLPSYCQIRFIPVDAEGNSLMENQEFLNQVKEGTTFTYGGVTSDIETVYTGSKLKLKLTNESFGKLENELRILFGSFHTVKILKDQKLEINWFDGSKDIVDINFLYICRFVSDPESVSYNPNAPQNELDIRVNGELLDPGYQSGIVSIMVFAYKKVFDWK